MILNALLVNIWLKTKALSVGLFPKIPIN